MELLKIDLVVVLCLAQQVFVLRQVVLAQQVLVETNY